MRTRDALEVLHYYNATPTLRAKFISGLENFQHKLNIELRYITMSPGIPRIIFRAFVCIMIALASLMVVQDNMSIGELTGLIAVGTNIVDPLQEINIAWSKWTRASISLERIAQELTPQSKSTATDVQNDKVSEPQDNDLSQSASDEQTSAQTEPTSALIEPHSLTEGLHFQGISFSYRENTPVLKNIELVLPAQGLFWLSGVNGSGKSTFFRLLSGDFQPNSGEIYWDNQRLSNFPSTQRRQMIRTVPQRVFLFDTTILDNLLICNADKTEQDVLNKFSELGLIPFLENFSEGLSTRVGRRGSYLSGGQAQLICLVRALLCDPDVLLLDEPFAAIDTEKSQMMIDVLHSIAKIVFC